MSVTPRVYPPPASPDVLAADGPQDPIRSSALAHQPEALALFMKLYGVLWSEGELDHPTKELARLRNARVTGCGFCRNVRFSVAKEQGLSEDMVEQIRDGYEESSLSDRQKLVLRYTDAMLTVPPETPNAELQKSMQAEFSDSEIVELTAGIALFMGFSKIAVSLGGVPEEMPVMEMRTPTVPETT